MTAQLQAKAGVGLRFPHYATFESTPGLVPWLEIHSENYLAFDSPRFKQLQRTRANYPISCHGVGLSLGTATGLDRDHLQRLRSLFDRIEPAMVSEHLSWSVADGVYTNDLLPLPYTEETLGIVAANVTLAQDVFGRRLLVENPSAYVRFAAVDMDEPTFLNELTRRTGCGLLLDINNIYVTGQNTGQDPALWLQQLKADTVGEYHLAGHTATDVAGAPVLIDTHGGMVCDAVWALYDKAIQTIGAHPTLVEWDTDVPELPVLLAEQAKAQARLDGLGVRHAA